MPCFDVAQAAAAFEVSPEGIAARIRHTPVCLKSRCTIVHIESPEHRARSCCDSATRPVEYIPCS